MKKSKIKIDTIKYIFDVFIVFCVSCEFFNHVSCGQTPCKTCVSYTWKKKNSALDIKGRYTNSKDHYWKKNVWKNCQQSDLFEIIFNSIVEGKR